MRGYVIGTIIQLAICVLLVVGWVKCINKAINCNWDPIGKAEVIYTAGVFLGYGGIIGWIDIKDE
jgi:hypothetical protein